MLVLLTDKVNTGRGEEETGIELKKIFHFEEGKILTKKKNVEFEMSIEHPCKSNMNNLSLHK